MSIEEGISDLSNEVAGVTNKVDDLISAFCRAHGHNYDDFPYKTHCALCGEKKPSRAEMAKRIAKQVQEIADSMGAAEASRATLLEAILEDRPDLAFLFSPEGPERKEHD